MSLILPREYVKHETEKRICVVDTETDPFLAGRAVSPFTLGFFDGVQYKDFWGDDCVHQFFTWLKDKYDEPLLIYAHNGGGFDFFFMLDYMDDNSEPVIIHGRLTKLFLQGQEFRDSFKIIPAPLSAYQKDEIDYNKFERGERELYRDEILHYQRMDCEYLHRLVTRYHAEFGDQLTIGSTAIQYLRHFHGFEKLKDFQDDKYRTFYYGGRNQCFESGILPSSRGWKVYDVNSMYPHTMRAYTHPIGNLSSPGKFIGPSTCFVKWRGRNMGAVPIRSPDGSLDFTCDRGEFYSTIHEINAGLETGTIRIERIIKVYNFADRTDFATFIDFFYELRLAAKAEGDKIMDLFYKLLMNNSYGKFAQDPRNYKDYLFTLGTVPEEPLKGENDNDPSDGWELASTNNGTFMWQRAAANRKRGFRNVATAASITGAARAELLHGISKASRPIYCDTDSLVCEALSADLDAKRLGAWKLEAEADRADIAGKKLYALYQGNECVKSASKGAKLQPWEISRVAAGDVVRYSNPVPNFQLNGAQEFVTRNIRRTG